MEAELSGHRNKPLLVPILCENDEEMLHARTVREIQIASNFAVLKSSATARNNDIAMPSAKRMKTGTNEKEHQQYDLAIETAILVQKEIEQWENSIRELEIMLRNQEQQQQHHELLLPTNGLIHDAPEPIDAVEVVKKNNAPPSVSNRTYSVVSAATEPRVAVVDEDNVVVNDDAIQGHVLWDAMASSSPMVLPEFEINTATTLSSVSSSST